ncbi:MAG: FliI/YscN family ATPase [Rhodoblastus sp.]
MTAAGGARDALAQLEHLVATFSPVRDAVLVGGKVAEIGAGHYRIAGLGRRSEVRDILLAADDERPIAEISRLDVSDAVAIPFDRDTRLRIGDHVFRQGPLEIAPSPAWLGRTLDALAQPIDRRGPLPGGSKARSIFASSPAALTRRRITQGISTGVKAVDLFTPLCVGQRVGIFAGSGVGKSTLIGMLATAEGFDVIVVGLIGERGREVREFIESTLGPSLERAVTVVATGDESALLRRTAAYTAVTVAEHFRDEGHSVLLVMDSVTRLALAAREIAIAQGEPPVSRGFPPSVFADLPRLLERSGPGPEGAGDITGVFAVLVDGDDHNDPVADTVRGILDGHIVLDRAVAAQGRYPAVDIPASLSRLAHIALSPERQAFSAKFRNLVAIFEESRDLRAMGGYQSGLDPDLDAAVAIVPGLYSLIGQPREAGPAGDVFKEVADMLSANLSSGTRRLT